MCSSDLAEHQITSDDFILAGINGDASGDEIYHVILNDIFRNNATGMYKHLCGEYHTASAFACWLSAFMLKERKVPEIILDANSHGIAPKRILILNHYKGREYSMMLLEKC